MPESVRPLSTIAADIRTNWPQPSNYALPYLQAMSRLTSIHEAYGLDSAISVVAYFLANAATWRGPAARRIKQELREILRSTGYKL